MRRTILSLFAALSLLPSQAQDNKLSLGFCDGKMADQTDIELNGKGWTECALRLTASNLEAYKGNSIVAVRAALVARINTDTLRVWVMDALKGDTLASGTAVRKGTSGIVRGWNEVAFYKPFTIPQDAKDIFVGYSLHQKANVKAVSVVEPSMPNTSYLKLGKEAWKDISKDGVLSIEAVVSGTSVPAHDLGITSASVMPDPSAGPTAMRLEANVHNYGSEEISGFSLTCTTEGANPATIHFDQEVASVGNAIVSATFDPGVATDESTAWTVAVASLDGADDEREGNNTATATYTFRRNVLIEEFTTEKCSNCPRVATLLHAVLEDPNYGERAFAVTHHAGYYTDKFTLPCDEELLWLFNAGGYTYAPGVMVDRNALFESKTGKKTAVFIPSSVDQLKTALDEFMKAKADAIVGVSLAFNADSTQVTATVTALRNANYSSPSPRLNVYLLEDEIPTEDQQAATSPYYQQHVKRGYDSTWGEPVSWDGNSFTYVKTFDIDKAWSKQNMEVVAFLHNYDASDPAECYVDNAARARLIEDKGTSGLRQAQAKAPYEVARYAIDGTPVGRDFSGMVIIKMSDGSVRKVLRAK